MISILFSDIELQERTGSPRALNFSPYEEEPEPRPAERKLTADNIIKMNDNLQFYAAYK